MVDGMPYKYLNPFRLYCYDKEQKLIRQDSCSSEVTCLKMIREYAKCPGVVNYEEMIPNQITWKTLTKIFKSPILFVLLMKFPHGTSVNLNFVDLLILLWKLCFFSENQNITFFKRWFLKTSIIPFHSLRNLAWKRK